MVYPSVQTESGSIIFLGRGHFTLYRNHDRVMLGLPGVEEEYRLATLPVSCIVPSKEDPVVERDRRLDIALRRLAEILSAMINGPPVAHAIVNLREWFDPEFK